MTNGAENGTEESTRELLLNGAPSMLKWEDDDMALRAAAIASRLPYSKMTSHEIGCFPDLSASEPSMRYYLYLRNRLLQMWHLEPNIELTLDDALKSLPKPFDSDRILVNRVLGFLTRYGFVNFGIFFQITHPVTLRRPKKRVIIIGAGMAGAAASNQLVKFGFDVVVLESSSIMGGRAQPVNTEHKECGRVRFDLGCSFINGVVGNPLTVLMKQVNFSPLPIRTEMHVFDEFGKQISTKRDQLLEATFVNISDSVDYITKERGLKTLFGKPMNLNDVYEHMANLLELHVRKTRLQYWNQYSEVVNMLADTQKQIELYEETIRTIGEKIDDLDNKRRERYAQEEQVLRRCLTKELEKALTAFDQATERYANLQMALSNVKKKEPCVTYMNQRDLRLLDFYKALREFVVGGQLADMSAEHWDQECREENETHKFAPYRISDTIYTLIRTIAAKNTIQMEHHVTKIEYNEQGVKVTAKVGEDEKEQVFTGDAVLSTIPLGVLKRSIALSADKEDSKENGNDAKEEGEKKSAQNDAIPRFEPPLPEEKIQAIRNMGCGSVAKLALVFEKQFWDAMTDFVGHLNATRESRGEMFLFFCHQNQPVIEIFFSGQAALSMDADLESTTRKAMTVLNQIYGGACPKWPTNIYVTNFTKNRTHFGTHSHVTPGNDGSEYDVMAEPVRAKVNNSHTGTERLFFAGEHTCRAAPSTLHGAFMSGLREAARIADLHLGCPFARDKEVECIELDDDESEHDENADDKKLENGEKTQDESPLLIDSTATDVQDPKTQDEEEAMAVGETSEKQTGKTSEDNAMEVGSEEKTGETHSEDNKE